MNVRHKGRRKVIVAVEYVFALAALTNAAALSWQLGTRTVTSIATEVDFLPATWAVLGIAVHGVGVVLMRLRARRTDGPIEPEPEEQPSVRIWARRFWSELPMFWKNEFGRYEGEKPPPMYVKWYPETKVYIAGSWFHSTGTVVHIIFGTLIFSGMYFVGPRDATQILGRYMASIVGCRIVLMYELAIIRECYNAGLQKKADEQIYCAECENLEECIRCGRVKDKSNMKIANFPFDGSEEYTKGRVIHQEVLPVVNTKQRRTLP